MTDEFFKYPKWLMESEDFTPIEKMVWVVLEDRYSFFKKQGTPHYDTLKFIETTVCASKTKVQEVLKKLIELGVVKAHKVGIGGDGRPLIASGGTSKNPVRKWVFDWVCPVSKDWRKVILAPATGNPKKVTNPTIPPTTKPTTKVYVPELDIEELDTEDPDDGCPF